jgi:hypothetical protein
LEFWSQIILPFLISSWWIGLSSFHSSVLHPIHSHQHKDAFIWEERVPLPGQYYQINRYNRDGILIQSYGLDELDRKTSLSYYDSKGNIWRKDSLMYRGDTLIGFDAYSFSTQELLLKAAKTSQGSIVTYNWFDGEDENLGSIKDDTSGMHLLYADANNQTIWTYVDSVTSITFDLENGLETTNHRLDNGRYFAVTMDTLGFIHAIQETDARGFEIFRSDFRYVAHKVLETRTVTPSIKFQLDESSIQRTKIQLQLLASKDRKTQSYLGKNFAFQEFIENKELSSTREHVEDQYLPDGKTLFRRRYLKDNGITFKEIFYTFSANGQETITYHFDDKARVRQIYQPKPTQNHFYFRKYYDDDNHLIREEILDNHQRILEITRYTFDSFSKLAFMEKIDMLGKTRAIQEVYGIPHASIFRKREADGKLIADFYHDAKGNVSKTVYYNYIDDMIFADYYDENKDLFKQRRYSIDGAIDHRILLNATGQILNEQYFSPQKELLKERQYLLDEKKITEVRYNPYGKFISKTITQLNDADEPISKKTIDEALNLSEIQGFEYGEFGVQLRQLMTGDGTIIFTVATDYDSSGNKQFETWTDAEDLMYRKVIFQYDNFNRLAREILMSPYSSTPEVFEYQYGVTGHLILKKHFEKDELTEEINFRYYSKHNLRMLIYKLADGTITRKELENL